MVPTIRPRTPQGGRTLIGTVGGIRSESRAGIPRNGGRDHLGIRTRISTQEIFGPVVAVYRYRNLDDAIRQANALPTAFQASIFAQDIDVAMRAANRLDASAVMINDPTTFRTDWMPFAGRKASGYGTGGIPYTMRDMTEEKMILMQTS